jgi:Tfp pilus assembly protein PilE
MMHTRRDGGRALSGFTMVELLVGTTILFVLAAALTQSVSSMKKLTVHGTVDSELQNMAERSLAAITLDMKHSGFASVAGTPYPYLELLDGVPTGASAASFAIHAHAAPAHSAQAGDSDFGPNREIVFLAPQFSEMKRLSDGTNIPVADATPVGLTVVKIYAVPTIDGSGNMAWNGIDYSYVVVQHADGVNYLERRENGVNPVVIAHHVERVTFESNAQDLFKIPLNAVRARIWLRMRDDNGRMHRAFAEAMVALRNG